MKLGWLAALRNSRDGLAHGWTKERPVRQEIVVTGAGLLTAPLVASDPLHGIALVGVLLMMLIVELLNVAIEAICDLVSPERNPMVKIAKDCGSAAVLLSIILAGLVWFEALWRLLMAA